MKLLLAFAPLLTMGVLMGRRICWFPAVKPIAPGTRNTFSPNRRDLVADSPSMFQDLKS